MIKIFIGEDHAIVRDGLISLIREIPEIIVIGEGSTGKEILEKVSHDADVVLLDINMPVLNGLETTRLLCQKFKNLKVLALSMLDHEAHVAEMFFAGAKGYLLKNTGKEELLYAIKRVHNGGMYVSPEIIVNVLKKISFEVRDNPNLNITLSKREKEVLILMAEGLTNHEIANRLFTSRRTIETHRKNLIEKTGSKNTASLIRFALVNGLLRVE